MNQYDICVIGVGSAGLVAATTANRLGAKAALIEKNKIGDECLHSGCVPSKTFIHTANVLNIINNASKLGLEIVAVRPALHIEGIKPSFIILINC